MPKFTCSREVFAHLFHLASTAAAVKDIKAVLQNVKMTVEPDLLSLQATDMDVAIRLTTDQVVVDEPGTVVLPKLLFRGILQESSDETFTLESAQGRVSVFEGRYKNIPTQDADEFPDMSPFPTDAWHEIPTRVLREMIRRTSFAIDPENTKYTLGGVLFEFEEASIAAVATDGKRLAHQEGAAVRHGDHEATGSVIVPRKALTLLERILDVGGDAPARIAIGKGQAAFTAGAATLTTRLIEGRFPRWKTIIPDPAEREQVDLMVGPFYLAIRQAAIITQDKQPGILLDFAEGRLEISSQGAEIGESKIEMPIVYSGGGNRLKMDPRFLTEFLKGLDSGAVISLYMKSDQSVLFRTGDGYDYVVMPLIS